MEIPFRRQDNEEYCGPAVLQMILGAHGIEKTQDELAAEANTPVNDPDHGTEIKDLVGVLEKYGFAVDAREHRTIADLRAALAGGNIVLVVFTERAYGWGHYALVRSVSDMRIELIDPDQDAGGEPMALAEFEHRWNDPTHTKTHRFAAFIAPAR